MLNNYLVRSNGLYSFYHTDGGIVCRDYENGRWSAEQTVYPSARRNYTVSLDSEGGIYLFCQDSAGDIILCTRENAEFKKRRILKNHSDKIYTLQLNPIITQAGICLVYNLPEDDGSYIAMQHSLPGGEWSQPERIDRFTALGDSMFVLQQIHGGHHILFYQSDMGLGYREITPDKKGAFHAFQSSSFSVTDSSFLTTENAIHVIYVLKTLFSSRLVYRKKDGDSFGEVQTICEGQSLENCMLFCVNGKMYASFISAGQLYVCESGRDGFSKPELYRKKCCMNPVKAVYISGEPMDSSKYFLRQVYVDRNHPYDIQLLPDLYDGFYPPAVVEKIPPGEAELLELQTEVELLQKRNREQALQIEYLTKLLQKGEHIESEQSKA